MQHTAEQLTQHVVDLCVAFDVALAIDPDMKPDEGFAGLFRHPFTGETRKGIRIPRIVDLTTYAAALHEIGHCEAPLGMLHGEMTTQMQRLKLPDTLRDVRLKLDSERAAWDWAQHYALVWTPEMEAVRRMTFGTYERWARRYLGGRP